MQVFYHSGRIGDIVYSLPTIKALGGGALITGLPIESHNALAPLLQTQSYIERIGRIEDEPLPKGFINLDLFRQISELGKIHLVNAHLRAFGLTDHTFKEGGWLEGFENFRQPNKSYAVINVTGRYEDKLCSWSREIRYLGRCTKPERVYFLGHHREYLEIDYRVTYWPTKDFLEAAHVIAKAKYFSGCQSSLLAIRQAIGMPYRLMQSPNHQDCNQYSKQETVINRRSRKLHLLLTTLKSIAT